MFKDDAREVYANGCYSSIKGNTFKWRDFVLEDIDEIIPEGILLVVRKGEYYSFYLPNREAPGSSSFELVGDKLICIFENTREYVYHKGLLLIKDGNEEKGNWIIICPDSFAWYLTPERAEGRIKTSPRIPYTGKSNVNILEEYDDITGAAMINVDEQLYYVEKVGFSVYEAEEQLMIQKLNKVEKIKIRDFLKVFNEDESCSFFEFGTKFDGNYAKYAKIEEFSNEDYEYIDEHYHGYWCYNKDGDVEAFRIGKQIYEQINTSYEYFIKFSEPIQEIKFLKRLIIEESTDAREELRIYPNLAVDIWRFNQKGVEKYLFKSIGEKRREFEFIVPKELLLK